MTALSTKADASSLPSGENATALNQCVSSLSSFTAAPVVASHTMTILPYEADATSFPSGENATAILRLTCFGKAGARASLFSGAKQSF
jgi:hypothetical protein